LIKVGIVGATGYTGVELLRLLASRSDVDICVVTSRELAGTAVSKHFPNLRGYIVLDFSAPDAQVLNQCDVVFFATPHAVAMHSVPALLDAGVRVIDLSADFRIKDIAVWERWYKTAHVCPQLVEQAVYGLPEVNREAIKPAQLVAVPGCYPTAIQLGFLPLLEAGLIETDRLIADAKSGVSGAGRKAAVDFLLCETTESIRAYGVDGHRHLPEICQGLSAPVKTGTKVTTGQLQSIFEDRYANEPFVDVLPQGELPATRDVKGSNNCEIAVKYLAETDTVLVLSAEDNLVKGASGQAIQNMNIMFGLPETSGLRSIALLP
jgi:N-acetyl-gamma-glutamyl-phosphate reductase